jgi:short subunit dehydrogenase-like uncharacterized protein
MRITVYGAQGFTGSLIAERLVAAGYRPRLAARNPQHQGHSSAAWIQNLERMACDLTSPTDRQNLLKSTDILIQAAGPYAVLPTEWYADLAQWQGTYIDLCGESEWLKTQLTQHAASVNAVAGLWLPACAFESAFALGLVALLRKQMPSPSAAGMQVKTFYRHQQPRLSPGTKATARLSRGHAADLWSQSQWKKPTRTENHWEINTDLHAVFSPLPEMPLLALDPAIASCASYLVLPAEEASLFVTLQAAPAVEKNRKSIVIPSLEERMAHQFVLAAEVICSAPQSRIVGTLKGRDPYGLTAKWVAATVHGLVEQGIGQPRLRGIASPIQGLNTLHSFAHFIREENLHLAFCLSTTSSLGDALAF